MVPFAVTLAEAITWEMAGISPPDLLARRFADQPVAECSVCGQGIEVADQPCPGPEEDQR